MNLNELTPNQFLLFVFGKSDKAKIYAHAKRSQFKIHLIERTTSYIGIYFPKMKITRIDLTTNYEDAKAYIKFNEKLVENGIKFNVAVYDEINYTNRLFKIETE